MMPAGFAEVIFEKRCCIICTEHFFSHKSGGRHETVCRNFSRSHTHTWVFGIDPLDAEIGGRSTREALWGTSLPDAG